jgi:hypothetical protein
LGGFVSASVGLGKGDDKKGSIGLQAGTNGASINGGFAGFNASVGTNGVGLGYGFSSTSAGKGTASKSTLGINLNYNYNSGLSGGISMSSKTNTLDNKGDVTSSKSGSIGLNFSSQGLSVNAKINGAGAGISSSSSSISGGDYDINVSSTGFFIPAVIFYVNFSHTNVKYSLFKEKLLHTSGILNAVDANRVKLRDNGTASSIMEEDTFMDVTVIPEYELDMEITYSP